MGRRVTDHSTYRYISKLQTKSEAHQKRFAFGVSGMITLMIFSIWSVTRTSVGDVIAAKEPAPQNIVVLEGEITPKRNIAKKPEVTPFGSFSSGLAASYAVFKDGFIDAKKEMEKIDIEALNEEYTAARNQALQEGR